MKTILISLIIPVVIASFFAVIPSQAQAYGECDDYGVMAMYDILSDSCKCMSGYVMGKGVLGDTQCVSGTSACYDKYGYNAQYDSLSKSCECRSGYSFASKYGQTQCVSNDSQCSDQIGLHSRYNSLSDACECSYGYVLKDGRCTDGDQVCHSRHGYNSSYSDASNKCTCNSDYTLDDANQCVERQNNVYFKLLDVDTDNRLAIVKSDYDSRSYLIEYGSSCYSFSISRYVNSKVVINLGTDYDLDTYDTLVLQDDDETCDIRSRERTFDDELTREDEEEEDSTEYVYIPTAAVPPTATPQVTRKEVVNSIPPTPKPVKPSSETPSLLRKPETAVPALAPTPATTTPQISTSSASTEPTPMWVTRVWRSILNWFN